MEKFIPYEKLSKKEQKKLNNARRNTWGQMNPTTRKPENSRAYNRRKAQSWRNDASQFCAQPSMRQIRTASLLIVSAMSILHFI